MDKIDDKERPTLVLTKFSSLRWKTKMTQMWENSSRLRREYSGLLNFSPILETSIKPHEPGETVGWRGLPFLLEWQDRTNPIGRNENSSTSGEDVNRSLLEAAVLATSGEAPVTPDLAVLR